MELDFSLVGTAAIDAIAEGARQQAQNPPTNAPDAPAAGSIGRDVKAGLEGATTGLAAVAAVTAGAVAMGTFIATGSVEAAVGMAAVAAGAAAGSELGPIGAAVGAVIGVMVAAGGPATNPPMAFAPTDPVATFKRLVAPLPPEFDPPGAMPSNSMLIEVLKDPKAAIAMTLWVANPDFSYFNVWLADFLANPRNPGRMHAAAFLRAHPEDLDMIHVGRSPLQHLALAIGTLKWVSLHSPATGAHQWADFEVVLGTDDVNYGGLMLAHPDDVHLDLGTYTAVLSVIAVDAKSPPFVPTLPPLKILVSKKGSAMHEALEFAKEKAEEAVEVVYKDGKVTKVGKGVGIAAGILVVLKVLAGRR